MFAFNDVSPFEDLFRLRREMNQIFSDFDRSFGVQQQHDPFLRDPFFHPALQQHNQQLQPKLQQTPKDSKADEKYESGSGSGSEQKADTAMNVESTAGSTIATGAADNNSLAQVPQNPTPALFRPRSDWLTGFPRINLPKCDVVETADSYLVSCDLPGMAKDDVKLSVNDNGVLTITAERSTATEQKDPQAKYHRVERHSGKYQRSLPLPKNVDLDKVSAKHELGLLKIVLPKRQTKPDSAKQIQIQ